MIGLLAADLFNGALPEWSREACRKPTGIVVTSLADWHRVIDWWFDKYGRYAVAAKWQLAYNRDIDHVRVPPEVAEAPFKKLLAGQPLTAAEQKRRRLREVTLGTDRMGVPKGMIEVIP